MDRKSLTFSAILAGSITLSPILITAQPKGARPNAGSVKQPNNPQKIQSIADQQTERELKAIGEELRAIREQAAQAERARASQQKDYGPPIWSNWVYVIVTAVAGFVAYRAFTHQRDAVRLTQRADVLVASIGFDPKPVGRNVNGVVVYGMPTNGSIVASFKNYGPTRASDVKWDLVPIVDGVEATKSTEPPETALIVIAAGDDIRPRTGPISAYYDPPVLNEISTGHTRMKVKATISYTDVFGKHHHTMQYASYYNGGFVIDEDMESD